ncbi:MAG TPA: hypothetical protein VL475_06865 [Planctomycetaceae bacterium]|jgi:hypothetical protein|nr:hypothetical protein [Planctomycetaceae bacterium]
MISTPSSFSLRDLAHRSGGASFGDGPVLLLEAVGNQEPEPPILLDQPTTRVTVSTSSDRPTVQFAIHRNSEGWSLEVRGVDCWRNGQRVAQSPISEGDRIVVDNTEFRVRTATTGELLGHLPQFGETTQRLADRELAIEARERDLAEWEKCLAECEADLRLREMAIEHRQSTPAEPWVGEHAADTATEVPAVGADEANSDFLRELEQLRTDRVTFENDRQRLHQWLVALQKERAELKVELDRLSADRTALAPHETRLMPAAATAASAAISADELASQLSEMLAAEAATECSSEPAELEELARAQTGHASDERISPRDEARETRVRLNHLRGIVNDSARQALKRHFWRHHRSAFVLKIALAAMSFALAGVLYSNHGITNSPMGAIAWGSAAIGLITLSGLFHTWTEVNRLNHRFRAPITSEPQDALGAGS